MSDFSGLNSACLAAFGESLTYTPAGGAAFAITAIVNSGTSAGGTVGASIILWARLADFITAPHKGDQATWSGHTYRVAEEPNPHGDGAGGVQLVLRQVS